MSLLNWYLKPKSIEAGGKLYEKLGIRAFKKITPLEILGRMKNRKTKTLKRVSAAGLRKYFSDTIAGEIAHLFSFVFLLSISIYFGFQALYSRSIVLFLFNIALNLYPIFLMRYNRFEIARVLKISVATMLEEIGNR